MANAVSFAAGSFLLVVCIMVMWEYRPRGGVFLTAVTMLSFGIFLGFAGSAFNTFYWQILNVLNDSFKVVSNENFQVTGRYLDAVFKGLPAVAGMIHLSAKRKMMKELDNAPR